MRKYAALFSVLLLLAASQAAAAIAFDAVSSGTGDGVTSLVVSHTTAGANRFMIVCVGYDADAVSFPVTAVTYDGVAVPLCDQDEGTDQGQQGFTVVGPNVGTHPVTILLNASAKIAAGIRTYTGVNQTNPVGASACNIATGTSASVTISTVEDSAWVIGCIAWEGSGVITSGAGQTERYQTTITGGGPGSRTTVLGDDEPTTLPDNYVMSYSYTIPNQAIIGAFSLVPENGAASPTPTRTVTATTTPGPSTFMRPWPYTGPVYVVKEDTVALLRMENDVWDESNIYTWTNQSSVPFSNTTWKVNLYSAGPYDDTDADACIHSGAIAETIKTVETWFYWPTGHNNANRYVVSFGAPTRIPIFAQSNAVSFYDGSEWSATHAVSDDTWYALAVTFDTDGWHFFEGNVERMSKGNTPATNGKAWHFGNSAAHTGEACDCFLDHCTLSSVVRTSFPSE